MSQQPIDLNQLSSELTRHIVQQDYSLYTAMDHASWRYIMRVNKIFFSQYGFPRYWEGIHDTGIPMDEIPRIEHMDACLQRLGWRAVAVSGFIPPSVFLEMQATGVLPIACDMRTLEHIAYTPAPDIVHEAAGHTPFLINPDYSEYLRKYCEIARKAIFSAEDLAVYEAVRHLSIVKEEPSSTEADITRAQDRLDRALTANTYVSEATLLGRMAWWSTEYGLIQDGDRALIFGAGLLSSVGESYNSLKSEVRKIPFTIDSINVAFDITRPQPQLFVTPDFATLHRVLEELSSQMAFRRGGYDGLAKAKMARTTTTSVLDSGLQISGKLTDVWFNSQLGPYFIKYEGPTQLAFDDQELEGHSAKTHQHGFSSPIGPIRKLNKSADQLSDSDLHQMGFANGKSGRMEFESGLALEGVLSRRVEMKGKTLLLSFTDCTIRKDEQVLYRPEWGAFDLACGSCVVSVFGGAADRTRYFQVVANEHDHSPGRPKTNLTKANETLNRMYARVREVRTNKLKNTADELQQIFVAAKTQYPKDWLLTLELLELAQSGYAESDFANTLQHHLQDLAQNPDCKSLIERGLETLTSPLTKSSI